MHPVRYSSCPFQIVCRRGRCDLRRRVGFVEIAQGLHSQNCQSAKVTQGGHPLSPQVTRFKERSDLASALHHGCWRQSMKSTLFVLATCTIAVGFTAFGQNTSQPNPQVQGRGRGGAPYAWGDRNGDGMCDFTGMPVGQGRAQMMSNGGRGRQGWVHAVKGLSCQIQVRPPAEFLDTPGVLEFVGFSPVPGGIDCQPLSLAHLGHRGADTNRHQAARAGSGRL